MTYIPTNSNTGPSYPPSANQPTPTGQLANDASPLGTDNPVTGRYPTATQTFMLQLNADNIGKIVPVT